MKEKKKLFYYFKKTHQNLKLNKQTLLVILTKMLIIINHLFICILFSFTYF